MILGALDDAGGQAYLAEQAHQNPAAFLTLLARLLPREPIESPPAVIKMDFGWRPPAPAPLPPLFHDNQLPEVMMPEQATLLSLPRSGDHER
jgi:hypothetical protein